MRWHERLIVAVVAVLMAACSGVPSGVIPPEKMARLLADIHIGEAVVDGSMSTFRNDSTKQLLKQSICVRNGVTVSDLDSSLVWYGQHVDKYSKVYERTVEMLEEDAKRQAEEAASKLELREIVAFQAEGDSVDIWPNFRTRAFTPRMASDRVNFEINSDRYWEQGDIYELRFKLVNPRHAMTAVMLADYQEGNQSYITAKPAESGWHSLVLRLDPERNGSKISGYLAYPTDSLIDRFPTVTTIVDSIMLIRMRSGRKNPNPGEGIQREIAAK